MVYFKHIFIGNDLILLQRAISLSFPHSHNQKNADDMFDLAFLHNLILNIGTYKVALQHPDIWLNMLSENQYEKANSISHYYTPCNIITPSFGHTNISHILDYSMIAMNK